MRLLLDEHYAPELAERLRERGHDVRAVEELGLSGADDERLLEHATSERRAVLTNNVKHFAPLLKHWAEQGRDHCGVLFTDDRSMPRGKGTLGRYLETLGQTLNEHPADDSLENQSLWLP